MQDLWHRQGWGGVPQGSWLSYIAGVVLSMLELYVVIPPTPHHTPASVSPNFLSTYFVPET